MFNVGPGEALAILVIALIVLGPDKLPEVIRTAGRVMSELRRISSGFQSELRNAVDSEVHDDERRPPGDASLDDKGRTRGRTTRQRRQNGAGTSASGEKSEPSASETSADPSEQPLDDPSGDEAH